MRMFNQCFGLCSSNKPRNALGGSLPGVPFLGFSHAHECVPAAGRPARHWQHAVAISSSHHTAQCYRNNIMSTNTQCNSFLPLLSPQDLSGKWPEQDSTGNRPTTGGSRHQKPRNHMAPTTSARCASGAVWSTQSHQCRFHDANVRACFGIFGCCICIRPPTTRQQFHVLDGSSLM